MQLKVFRKCSQVISRSFIKSLFTKYKHMESEVHILVSVVSNGRVFVCNVGIKFIKFFIRSGGDENLLEPSEIFNLQIFLKIGFETHHFLL